MATNLHPQMLQGSPLHSWIPEKYFYYFDHIMAEFLKMHFIVPFHVISTFKRTDTK